jgi:hypothetical protein
LPNVGANIRIDSNGQLISNRDSVDLRLLSEYGDELGVIPQDESAVGGYPTINSKIGYLDVDKDGMPDLYEKKNNFDPLDPIDSNLDKDGNGYTNLEEFLNNN